MMDGVKSVDADWAGSAKASAPHSPAIEPSVFEPEPLPLATWERQARQLQREAYVFYFAFRHPRVPWYARLLAVCIAAYLFSPIQFIPSYIPVIGFLDDFLVLFFGLKLLRRIIPRDVLAECRQSAEAAEKRRKQKIRSAAAIVVSVAIVSLWILAAVIASALMVRYIRRH